MAPQRISPSVVVETEHYGSNNSAIIGTDGVILVDAPHLLSDAHAWRTYVESFGPIRFLVHSDHHPDHTIGNFLIPGEIVAHAETRRRLATEPPSMEYLRDLLGRLDPEGDHWLDGYAVRLPTVVFEDAMTLHLENVRLELKYQRGHTRNSILSFLPEEGVLFTGDIVCEAGLPSFQDSRLVDWFDALDVVDSYDFEIVVPGHGQVTDRAGVARYRDLGRQVVADVAERLGKGQEKDQIVAQVRFEDNIHVPMGTNAGYPDDLIESFQERSVARIVEDLQETPGLVHR